MRQRWIYRDNVPERGTGNDDGDLEWRDDRGLDKTVVVEGNHYFPPGSIRRQFRRRVRRRAAVRGRVRRVLLVAGGRKTNEDAAWYYPEPSMAAANIKDYVAFWNGVDVR